MSSPLLRYADEDEAPDFTVPAPEVTTAEHISALDADLRRTANDFLHLPFSTLDTVVSGIPQGELWYVGAFSGDGKTTFLASLTLALESSGKRVYYVPTETPGKVIIGHLACCGLGYNIGDFQSGEYLKWPDAELAVQRVRVEKARFGSPIAALNNQATQRVWVAESGFLTEHRIYAEATIAAELKADVVIWDHADHAEDAGRGLYETSVSVQQAILTATRQHGLRSIASTQFNLEAVKGNRTLRYMAPRESYVYMGNVKRHVSNGMIGLYRPLKLQGLDLKLVGAFREGDASVNVRDILEPNTMCAYLMKHRKYGEREGHRVYLHVDHGRVQDFSERDLGGALHGIPTSRPSLV